MTTGVMVGTETETAVVTGAVAGQLPGFLGSLLRQTVCLAPASQQPPWPRHCCSLHRQPLMQNCNLDTVSANPVIGAKAMSMVLGSAACTVCSQAS